MPIDRNKMRATIGALRPLLIPLRTSRVTVRTRTWPGKRGQGTPVDVDLQLPAYVKIREVREREVAASGGKIEMGDLRISSITPEFPGGGLSPAQIAPKATSSSVEIIYVLTGTINGHYRRIAFHGDRPFRYELTLRRLNTTP